MYLPILAYLTQSTFSLQHFMICTQHQTHKDIKWVGRTRRNAIDIGIYCCQSLASQTSTERCLSFWYHLDWSSTPKTVVCGLFISSDFPWFHSKRLHSLIQSTVCSLWDVSSHTVKFPSNLLISNTSPIVN